MAWLKLIRWPNLLIIFLTQFLVWLCIIGPAVWGETYLIHWKNFLLLTLSTLFIAAAGYVINDYFDIRIDAINRPEKVVLETSIHRRNAILLHIFLNVLGLLLALKVAHQAGQYQWLLLQLGTIVLLWFYSTQFKRQFIIGNLVVAMATALSIQVPAIYEPALRAYSFLDIFSANPLNPLWLIAGYTFFAFMLTWMREIVKDMEDHIGDEAEGCETMPIKWGLKKTANFVQRLSLFTSMILLLAGFYLLFHKVVLMGLYAIVVLMGTLGFWTLQLHKKSTIAHYAFLSNRLKWIMILGVGALVINLANHYA